MQLRSLPPFVICAENRKVEFLLTINILYHVTAIDGNAGWRLSSSANSGCRSSVNGRVSVTAATSFSSSWRRAKLCAFLVIQWSLRLSDTPPMRRFYSCTDGFFIILPSYKQFQYGRRRCRTREGPLYNIPSQTEERNRSAPQIVKTLQKLCLTWSAKQRNLQTQLENCVACRKDKNHTLYSLQANVSGVHFRRHSMEQASEYRIAFFMEQAIGVSIRY